MNVKFEIINVTWRIKDTDSEFISFYVIPKIKSAHFYSNPDDLKLSLDATEIYSIEKREYRNNKSYHDQKIILFSDNISSRYAGNTLLSKHKTKAAAPKQTSTDDNTDNSISPPSPDIGNSQSALPPTQSDSITPPRPICRATSDSVSPAKRTKLSFTD